MIVVEDLQWNLEQTVCSSAGIDNLFEFMISDFACFLFVQIALLF
jgi:hypothetical protein